VGQCPDGTPPPCVARATPPAARPPAPGARSRTFLILPFRNLTRAPEHEWLVEGSPAMLADALGRWQDLMVVSEWEKSLLKLL